MSSAAPRPATPSDAETVARLLDAFNREFHAPTHRFYERHGYTSTEAGQDQPSFYYHRSV